VPYSLASSSSCPFTQLMTFTEPFTAVSACCKTRHNLLTMLRFTIEVYKLLTNKYDDSTVHLDINLDMMWV